MKTLVIGWLALCCCVLNARAQQPAWPWDATPLASTREELAVIADSKPTVQRSYGLRHLRVLDERQVELELGISVTGAVGDPAAYRIISFEDPGYAYEQFVRPVAAKVTVEAEAQSLDAKGGSAFQRTLVRLTVPTPLKPGATYTVLAQGVGGTMVTAGQCAASARGDAPSPRYEREVDQAVLGLRKVESVGSGVLRLECGPGLVPQLLKRDSIRVQVNGKETPLVRLARMSRVDAYQPVGWPFVAIPAHDLFVSLPQELTLGDRVTVEIDDKVLAGWRRGELRFDPQSSLSLSIKVNQLGYLAGGPVRVAYLGRWFGQNLSLGQAGPQRSDAEAFWSTVAGSQAAAEPDQAVPALGFNQPPIFSIHREHDGQQVWQGQSQLIRTAGQRVEGVRQVDHAGENVYLLDFTAFGQPGRYFISVPGVGRSHAFSVGDDVYAKAFAVQAHGLFIQRAGQALGPPHTPWRRVAAHNQGLQITTQSKLTPHDIKKLAEQVVFEDESLRVVNPLLAKLDKDESLLAYWPLAGDLKDVSGHERHLGRSKAAAAFTVDTRLPRPDPRVLGPTAAQDNGLTADGMLIDVDKGVSFAGWFANGEGVSFHGVLMGLGGQVWNEPKLQLTAKTGVLTVQGGIGSDAVRGQRLDQRAWSHLAVVLQPRTGQKPVATLYINGREVAGGEVDGRVAAERFHLSALDGPDAAGRLFAEVRVYGRPLLLQEVQALAQAYQRQPKRIMAVGGHYDAGDYNPRSHLGVAIELLMAYELAPAKFRDRQLNLPESGNGVPDMVDEAQWALQLWRGLQDSDGGVHHGTESNGDPNFIQSVELDELGDYAYAKDAAGSLWFAGAMAQSARVWRSLGQSGRADEDLARARRAYDWAQANPPAPGGGPAAFAKGWLDPLAFAAAQMLGTTGEARFQEDFAQAAVWSRQPEAELYRHNLYDQTRAAYCYAMIAPGKADAVLQQRVRQAIVRCADGYLRINQTQAYAFVREPYAPITWGTGAYQNWLWPIVFAHRLTGQTQYLAWIIRTCDNTLGANPMGLSYITNLGSRTVRAPLHNSRYSHWGVPMPGLGVQGPNERSEGYRVAETFFPTRQPELASLYSFVDAHCAISMNEPTVDTMARSMAIFGLLLPD